MSSWKMCHGLTVSSGLMGQNGILLEIMYAVHAMPAASSAWHQPSAARGEVTRSTHDPHRLPIARPTRNTARITEKTYTVAPSSIPSTRVQTTSAPSAPAPESAMVT